MAETTEAIRTTAGKLGLHMSFKKTELMSISKSTSPKPTLPLGNEGNIKVVEYFKCLVAFSSADGRNIKKLNNRTGIVAGEFRELEKVWKDRHLNLNIKMKFYNSCVFSTLLHAAECRNLTKRDEARLDRRVRYEMPKKDPANCVVTAYHK